MDFEVLAEGLLFPEGPIAMPDGSVVLVEIARGALTRVWNGRSEVIADLGGVKMAFKKVVSQTYMQMTIELADVQPNVTIDAARFAQPRP